MMPALADALVFVWLATRAETVPSPLMVVAARLNWSLAP